jgi:hypothetical protein
MRCECKPDKSNACLNFTSEFLPRIHDPIYYIPNLKESITKLHKEKVEAVVDFDTLLRGAELARMEHQLDIGDVSILKDMEKHGMEIQRSRAFWREPKDLLLTLGVCCLASLTQGKKVSFLTSILLPIWSCIRNSRVQATDIFSGWDQVATGNLRWPEDFGLEVNIDLHSKDAWIFGAVNAITWFSAAIIGYLALYEPTLTNVR